MLFNLVVIRLGIEKDGLSFQSTEVNEIFEKPEEIEERLSIDYLATEEQVEQFYDMKSSESTVIQIENTDTQRTYFCYISRLK